MIIGLAGAIGAGKDTVANILRRKYGFLHYKMAGKLKKMLEVLFDLPSSWNWELDKQSPHEALFGYSKRQVLQWYGTDGFPCDLKEILQNNRQYIVPELYLILFGTTRSNCSCFRDKYDFYLIDKVMIEGGFREKISPRFWADNIFTTAHIKDPSDFIKFNNIVISDVRFPEELEDPVKKYGYLVFIEGNHCISDLQKHSSESYLYYLKDNADIILPNNGSLLELESKVKYICTNQLAIPL